MSRTAKIFTILGATLAVLALVPLLAYYILTAGVRLDHEKLTLKPDCITVYDAYGEEIPSLAYDADVPYSAFPAYLTRAFVAVEDKRFFSHHGLDYKRMGKALLKNVATLSFREGASTISQQLIKNTHLSSKKTLRRKLREIRLTRRLEREYGKEEILALYLNTIYFGHSAFGVGDAAYFYFGKTPDLLTPAESAMLAALVRSPNRYSPFKDAERCLSRRNFVLSLMKEQGYLEEDEYRAALDEPLPAAPAGKAAQSAYLSRVMDELAEYFPDATSGEFGQLRVYTAFDPALQRELEKTETESDCVIVVRDNKTNAIKALHATAGTPNRLPASTIKPLLVYAPAIEEGLISPATPLEDKRCDFGGYSPDDAGGASNTYMSARYALSHSVNIPAVRLLNALGVDRGAAYLEKMSLSVPEDDHTLALALGGMREGFSLPSLADGYATLANGGMYTRSGAIVRIETSSGRVLFEKNAAARRVFSEDTAFLVNDMLKTAATEGTARKLKSLPFPVSAKTGTHESGGKNLDAYTIAYTPYDVVAVWLGNADNSPIDASGGGLPANIAKRVLEKLYEKNTPPEFQPTARVTLAAFDKIEYESKHKLTLADPAAPPLANLKDYFLLSSLPREKCTRYSVPHIEKPQISVKNGTVCIVLCHAEYYDYIIKRENRGVITTIYSGKFRETICDSSIRGGEKYTYTVIPVYKGVEGEAVELPSVCTERDVAPPEDWWDQNVMRSAVSSAASTRRSTSSFASSSSI